MKHLSGEHLLCPHCGVVHSDGKCTKALKICSEVRNQSIPKYSEQPTGDDFYWRANLMEFMNEGWLDDMYDYSPIYFDRFPDQGGPPEEHEHHSENHDLYLVFLILGLMVLFGLFRFVFFASADFDVIRHFWEAAL